MHLHALQTFVCKIARKSVNRSRMTIVRLSISRLSISRKSFNGSFRIRPRNLSPDLVLTCSCLPAGLLFFWEPSYCAVCRAITLYRGRREDCFALSEFSRSLLISIGQGKRAISSRNRRMPRIPRPGNGPVGAPPPKNWNPTEDKGADPPAHRDPI